MHPKMIKEFKITEDEYKNRNNDFISILQERGELYNEYYMFGVVYLTTDKNEPIGFVFAPVDNDWHMIEHIEDATGFPVVGWFGEKGEKDDNLYTVIDRLIMSWHENHENNDND